MNKKQIDRINGVLYGVFIGDALGCTTEFCTAEEIRANYGTLKDIIGGGWLSIYPGNGTDDTDMTLAVAAGIIDNPDNPIQAIGSHFIKWYYRNPKDMGNSCRIAITNAIRNTKNAAPTPNEWYEAALQAHLATGEKSAGNGTLMRTAYPAIYYPDRREALEKTVSISRMTHFDPLCEKYCKQYVGMIHDLIVTPTLGMEFIAETVDSYDKSITTRPPFPSGYVKDSFDAAMHCILTTDSLEAAIIKAVNLGGDADTIGAITGGLAGALYGFSTIPTRWLYALNPVICRKIDAYNAVALKNFDNPSQA